MNTYYDGVYEEVCAIGYLRKQGYRIKRLRHKTKYGEIDIIATQGDTLVILEVKGGHANRERVDREKETRLQNAGYAYMQAHEREYKSLRFDVLTINENQFTLLKNAF